MKRLFPILLCTCIAAVLAAQGQGQTGGSSGRRAPLGDVMDALSEMDSAFETADEELTPEDDYYLGRAVAVQILNTYKPYTDPVLISYLDKICQAITINSSQPEIFNGYHVGLLDTEEINAFATPGGHILLTLGIVGCADSEDALAAVIAHEVAHIQLRHAAAILNDQRLVNELSHVSGRAASIASRNAGPRERAVLFSGDITAMVTTLFKNGFAQEQEFEADRTAVGLLRDAGYDPSALVRMLEILEKVQPLRPGGFNTTHPSPAARLANLKTIPLTGEGGTTRASRDARFSAFQERLRRTR